MLPEPYRLRRHSDFSKTVRSGRRLGRRDVVVHVLLSDKPDGDHARFGLIVNKAVGNAVVRHRVARRLRHVCATLVNDDSLDLTGADIVIRALPGAATAPSTELARQLRGGLSKLLTRERS